MGFRCGIVGLPNVGKSSLFNVLTNSLQAQAANYPFCTIEPNQGVVNVPDKRLEQLVDLVKPRQFIPAQVEFVDIAGLVKGASQGEGLGNQFLGHIRQTDAIVQVLRCFEDSNITHIHNKLDPIDDYHTIETELFLADLTTLEKAEQNLKKLSKAEPKQSQTRLEVVQKISQNLSDGIASRITYQQLKSNFSADDLDFLKQLHLLSAKKEILLANLSEQDWSQGCEAFDKLKQFAKEKSLLCLPLCVQMEVELMDLDEDERREYLSELGAEQSGIEAFIRAGYKLLDLQTFFTAGEKEVKAWTIKKGALAVEAAGKIHSDIARGFIVAEVIGFKDYIELGGVLACKQQGKARQEGKDYIVQDGDIIEFRFNV